MALSALDDPARPPEPADLAPVLGAAQGLWTDLVAAVTTDHPPMDEAWNHGGPRTGWTLRLKRKDRVILYLIPQEGHFLVGVVLGEKALRLAGEAGLPASVLEAFMAARPYAEGRGIRWPVRGPEDVAIVRQLAAAKLAR